MHPLDQLMCELRSLTGALKAAMGAGSQTQQAPDVAATVSVQRFSNETHGKLAGRNPRRTGFKIHNATDGTLLIRFADERPSVAGGYNLAIGPGQVYETSELPQGVYRGEIRYAWITAQTDLTAYPAGVWEVATGGAVSYTGLAQ